MKEIVIVGAGKIGGTIANLLANTGDYRVTVVDRAQAQLDALDVSPLVVTRSAASSDVHYLDLTEDVASTRIVKQLSATAKTAFIPQCGLAPGFISIVANDLAKRFDTLESVRMRVGALPQYPSN
eukprot:gene30039-37047_t